MALAVLVFICVSRIHGESVCMDSANLACRFFDSSILAFPKQSSLKKPELLIMAKYRKDVAVQWWLKTLYIRLYKGGSIKLCVSDIVVSFEQSS
jgi:hypothetical protein